jgi:cell wall-associated NlpC family hydrolase
MSGVVGTISSLLVGINKPNWALGHGRYVRVVPGAPFDGPHSPKHDRLLEIAKSWLGAPYVWGGNTRDGVDCSGFVGGVFREYGIRLPRCSQDIGRCKKGKVISDELHFGDVLVFPNPHHCALYVGNGRTIEAVSGGVGYSTVWRRSKAVVRRFIVDL